MVFEGSRFPLAAGGISAALAVVAGAFGAHALRDSLDPRMAEAFETAARYQMYHALALIAVGLAGTHAIQKRRALFITAGNWFLGGTLLFSGSLYLMVLTGQKWLGTITPFGGVSFIAGWVLFTYAVVRRNS